MIKLGWSGRMSRIAVWLGAGALVLAIAGTTLARYDIVPKLTGFSGLAIGGLLAVVGVLVSLVALFLNWRTGAGAMRGAVLGLVLSGAFVLFIASRMMAAQDYPALHDISTDLADPPAFEVLELRADNLAGVDTLENWRKMHAEAYPDVQSVEIAKPVAQVIADAETLLKARGWPVAHVDAEAGKIEATATVSWIRFEDDVVIRARPTEAGDASIVDMRSVSRVGVGDLGVNAKRVRAFLADLGGG